MDTMSVRNPGISFCRLFGKVTTFFVVILFFAMQGFAQDRIVQRSCFDTTLKRQADNAKEHFAKEGYVLVREATMTMESQYEMPVIVPLTEGSLYEFVFIGDVNSKLYEVRMYDWDERQVVYKKNGMESNVIAYNYVPFSTEYHVIKPVQVSNIRKKKELCGYIMMFKKVKKEMAAAE